MSELIPIVIADGYIYKWWDFWYNDPRIDDIPRFRWLKQHGINISDVLKKLNGNEQYLVEMPRDLAIIYFLQFDKQPEQVFIP